MLHEELLAKLSAITPEEQAILQGEKVVNRALYYSKESTHGTEEVDSARILANGKMIDLRPHVRFVPFPKHRHNFVEFVYQCSGTTTHTIDGHTLILEEGDLLFLNQNAVQSIEAAGEKDIAVNFMILPAFFDTAFQMLGNEESALRDFIISCLTGKDKGGNYLYFHANGVLPIQNLLENLIFIMMSADPYKRSNAQITMGLLFLNLMNYTDRIDVPKSSYDEEMTIRLLTYIDSRYKDASLSVFSEENHLDIYTASRLIKRNTGLNFKELLQEKRMNQACFLLRSTDMTVDEIAYAVGYDNTSYFHRLFRRTFEKTPREYRNA